MIGIEFHGISGMTLLPQFLHQTGPWDRKKTLLEVSAIVSPARPEFVWAVSSLQIFPHYLIESMAVYIAREGFGPNLKILQGKFKRSKPNCFLLLISVHASQFYSKF